MKSMYLVTGRISNYLTTVFWLCIAGAFAKFAIFENRFFFLTRLQLRSEKNNNRFPFFSRFLYIPLNNKVLCGLLEEGGTSSAHHQIYSITLRM